MKTPAALALCLSLLAGLIACDKDDNMGTNVASVFIMIELLCIF